MDALIPFLVVILFGLIVFAAGVLFYEWTK